MKIGKACAVCMELIQIRCFEEGVSMAAEIAVSLVIGYHQNNVRPAIFSMRDACPMLPVTC